MQPIGSLFGVFYTWSVRVFHLDQTVLLLLKQLENFNIVHPLNLFTEMRSRGAISLLRVIRACGRMLVLSQGDLGGSLKWMGSGRSIRVALAYTDHARSLSFIPQSGHRGDPCTWTSHGGRWRGPAGTEEGPARQGYSPWVPVSLQTRCRPA